VSDVAAEVWAAVQRIVAESRRAKRISADAVTRMVPRGRPKVSAALRELHALGLVVAVAPRRKGELAWWVREADEANVTDEAASRGLTASAA